MLGTIAEFAYQMTPIPDAVDCLGNRDGGACVGVAIGFIPGARVVRAVDNMADAAKASRAGAGTCEVNSFVPGTKVLMADGTSKPIEDIQVGDRVLATDPVTGESGPRMVVGTITTQGPKDLVKLTVDIDGPSGNKTGTVVAAAAHALWNPQKGQWLNASDLRAREQLRTVDGTRVEIAAMVSDRRHQRVYNLTVAGVHTYYVLVGGVPTKLDTVVQNGKSIARPRLAWNGLQTLIQMETLWQVNVRGKRGGC